VSKTRAEFAQCRLIDENETRKLGLSGLDQSFLNIDAPWLLRLHTGNFGVINLQPYYSPLIGILTLLLVISGLSVLLRAPAGRSPML
jgi:hypothetical protein